MSTFSNFHPTHWPTVARCQAMLRAIGHQLSRIDDDERLYTAVAIVLGMLSCVLVIFAIFAI